MRDLDFKWGINSLGIEPTLSMVDKAKVYYTVVVYAIAFALPLDTDVEEAEHLAPDIFKQLLSDESAYYVGSRIDDVGDDVEQVFKNRRDVANNPLLSVGEQHWREQLVMANNYLKSSYTISSLVDQLRAALLPV